MIANSRMLIESIFEEVIELHGAHGGEDNSIYAGIGVLKNETVTFISQIREHELERCFATNFSMTLPIGYKKVIRFAKQAEKFKRPIIIFVDTIGADASEFSEKNGQGYRIAECMDELMKINVPVISILCGEGGSGGALALCVADVLLATEEGHLGVASLKACKSILGEMDEYLFSKIYMNAFELVNARIVSRIIENDYAEDIYAILRKLKRTPVWILKRHRRKKYRYLDR